jgi:DNA polymerase kappa
LCEELILIPCDYRKYGAVADVFREIIAEYDPNYETMGLDEAKLDVTEYLQTNDLDNPEGRQELARTIRRRVYDATKLTCSAGIGPNRMLAKIGSDENKPNG